MSQASLSYWEIVLFCTCFCIILVYMVVETAHAAKKRRDDLPYCYWKCWSAELYEKWFCHDPESWFTSLKKACQWVSKYEWEICTALPRREWSRYEWNTPCVGPQKCHSHLMCICVILQAPLCKHQFWWALSTQPATLRCLRLSTC